MTSTPAPRPVVLAVDDEGGVLAAYRMILADSCEVVTATSGEAALALLQQRPADVVLLDMVMPGLGGLAVLDRIQRARIDTRVVVVSAVNDARNAVAAVRLGAHDYVLKPFDADELTLTVRRVLEPPAPESPSTADLRSALPHLLLVSSRVGVRASLAVALRSRGRVDAVAGAPAALAVLARALPDVTIVDATETTTDAHVVAAVRTHLLDGSTITMEPRRPLDFARLLREVGDVLAVRHTNTRRFTGCVPRAMEHVAEHYPHARITEVADVAGVSPGHLARTFTEQMGMTAKQYVTRVRIEAARSLLAETDHKTDTIAEMVGLYDAPHLARVFRRHGCGTPASYRPL